MKINETVFLVQPRRLWKIAHARIAT